MSRQWPGIGSQLWDSWSGRIRWDFVFFQRRTHNDTFWESRNVPEMKTAEFTRRNAERFCCTHPTPVPQRLPRTPLITCPQPVEEKRARAFPGTSSWFYQVPRKTRRAKERQSGLIFVALQDSLLKAGGQLSFWYPSWGVRTADKEGSEEGVDLGSALYSM